MSFMSYFINFSGALYYTLSKAALCISGHILLLLLVNKHPDSPKRSKSSSVSKLICEHASTIVHNCQKYSRFLKE